MTPKQKALELVGKYFRPDKNSHKYKISIVNAKQYALITVDEIFEHIDYIFKELEKDNLPNKFDDEKEYWNEVKIEIEKL